MCIFGLQFNIKIFIIFLIKFNMKHKFLSILQECLIKSLLPYNAICWSIFYYLHRKDHYLLGIVFPYLEFLYFSEYGISTFVHHNPFGRIISINCNDPRQFKMLFVKWNRGYKLSFCNNVIMKMKQNKPY